MNSFDNYQRITRLTTIYGYLNDEETGLIAEYEIEYGDKGNWTEEVQEEFNNLHTPICEIKGSLLRYIDELKTTLT
jgi:hypothetical protein